MFRDVIGRSCRSKSSSDAALMAGVKVPAPSVPIRFGAKSGSSLRILVNNRLAISKKSTGWPYLSIAR